MPVTFFMVVVFVFVVIIVLNAKPKQNEIAISRVIKVAFFMVAINYFLFVIKCQKVWDSVICVHLNYAITNSFGLNNINTFSVVGRVALTNGLFERKFVISVYALNIISKLKR